jgi:hypothetical protein
LEEEDFGGLGGEDVVKPGVELLDVGGFDALVATLIEHADEAEFPALSVSASSVTLTRLCAMTRQRPPRSSRSAVPNSGIGPNDRL